MFGLFRIFFRCLVTERHVNVNVFNVFRLLALLGTCCLGAVGQVNNSGAICNRVSLGLTRRESKATYLDRLRGRPPGAAVL